MPLSLCCLWEQSRPQHSCRRGRNQSRTHQWNGKTISPFPLTVEERQLVYPEARNANPDVSGQEFALAYRIALLEAGVKKGGANLGEVDLSLFSGTDAEENSEDDSDSSEDGVKAIRDDLERQNQVSPP